MAMVMVEFNKALNRAIFAARTGLAVLLAAIAGFCCFYLLHTHDALASWYLQLNNCFYHAPCWAAHFFTSGIKSDGNLYCLIGMAITVAGIFYLFGKLRHSKPLQLTLRVPLADLLAAVALLPVLVFLWRWGYKMALPAYDEVFSAVNAAALPSFQCLSYYMLPNNHLFFNFLNGLLFHAVQDKVLTGRLISLAAYCTVIVMLFFWLRHTLHNRWLAFIAAVAVAMQFQTWGFSFQARSYELYLLCEWGALIALMSYLLSGNKRWLWPYVLSCITGYACLPSFLFFHMAFILCAALYQLVYRKKETAFWKYQLLVMAGVFLFYLPELCFSGIEAITHNHYVAPMEAYKNQSCLVFAQWAKDGVAPYFLNHIFSDVHWGAFSLNLLLFCLPLLLLANRKNKSHVLFGIFYIVMWLCAFALTIKMKRVPFERNLIGHYSVTLAGVSLVIYWLAGLKIKRELRMVRYTIFPAFVMFLIIHFKSAHTEMIKDKLYEYDVNHACTELNDALSFIPAGSTVGCSDESFYACYICMKNGCRTQKCADGNEQYYIKDDEDSPPVFMAQYTLVKSVGEYKVYKALAQ